ncbi:hypothetical protein Tco_0573347 [Tanacetum coccineum]
MTESPLVDSGFAIPVFSLRDDPIACLNKAMAFLTAVASSRLANSLTYATQGNTAWYKEKALLAEAQKAGQFLMKNNSHFWRIQGFQMVPHFETNLNDVENQSVHAMQDFEQPPAVDFKDNEIHNDMIKEKLALKEQVDSLEQNLSKQIKEKECLLQTITVFKSESKEKEDKYMENEIDLEKKIKELDNIIFESGSLLTRMPEIDDEKHFFWKRGLSDDFGKCFTAQQELSAEQAFWLRMSNHSSKPSDASPVKIEAPKELS